MLFRGLLVAFFLFATLFCEGRLNNTILQRNPNNSPKTSKNDNSEMIIFLPLDERFTTRDIFLNIAQIGDMEILTPPKNILCKLREPTNMEAMDNWLFSQIKAYPDRKLNLILSAEMFLFGGLIQSRVANTTTPEVMERVKMLTTLKDKYSNIDKVYLSSVVMRIPNANNAVEDVWYWELYGTLIFKYSFYFDKYQKTQDPADKKIADDTKAKIPDRILNDYYWRRERNFNVTSEIVKSMLAPKKPFNNVYITLDDNAEYGQNIKEANYLKNLITQLKLDNYFHMYPGADEVLLVMLSKFTSDTKYSAKSLPLPKVKVVYRDPNNKDAIPNYEGQSLNLSILSQIKAAGMIPVTSGDADMVLLANNWSEKQQHEAPDMQYQYAEKYDVFLNDVVSFGKQQRKPVCFADVRFSNGGDVNFVNWILALNQKIGYSAVKDRSAYAGWNTNGNTLGTVIANCLLLNTYSTPQTVPKQNTVFQLLRLLEDNFYQVYVRNALNSYCWNVVADSNLGADFPFFSRFTTKGLERYLSLIKSSSKLEEDYHVYDLYYPWSRSFEIGMNIHP